MKRFALSLVLVLLLPGWLLAAFTEFYCNFSSGNNLNGGSSEGSATATDAAATYNRDTGAGGLDRITASSGTPFSGVSAGEFVGVKAAGGAAPADFVGRVTAVNGGGASIDVSDAAASGTRPADAASVDVKVGGAWKGPNAASGFPFNFAAAAMTNSSGDTPRINLKNNAQYDITAGVSHTVAGPVCFEGYSSSAGDGGRATIDGGTTNAVLLTLSGADTELANLIFANNATGAVDGVQIGNVSRAYLRRCVVHNVRRGGFVLASVSSVVHFSECEAYACNAGNTANFGGFASTTTGTMFCDRCISHDNSGSNSHGFIVLGPLHARNCIADTNGGDGFLLNAVQVFSIIRCDSYDNTGDGIDLASSSQMCVNIENTNLLNNGGWGINGSGSGARYGRIHNCGFGAGTEDNDSGTTTGLKSIVAVGSVTYANDVTPWTDPADGDFRISLAAAKGAGRGAFLQTQSGYGDPNPTVGYPDIGAAQHQETGSSAFDPVISQ